MDTIIPYTSGQGLNSAADSAEPTDAEFFLNVTRGSRTKLALNLMPRLLSPDEYRRRAHALYRAGVEQLFSGTPTHATTSTLPGALCDGWATARSWRIGPRPDLRFSPPGRNLRNWAIGTQLCHAGIVSRADVAAYHSYMLSQEGCYRRQKRLRECNSAVTICSDRRLPHGLLFDRCLNLARSAYSLCPAARDRA